LFTIDGEPVFTAPGSKIDYMPRLMRLLAEWNIETRGPLIYVSRELNPVEIERRVNAITNHNR
jgi:hypothetical protein